MFSHYLRLALRRPALTRPLTMSAAPEFKPFTLAMIQLGQVGKDKTGTRVWLNRLACVNGCL